jgi:capsular exopolysaccharide synthesis family protein
MTNVPATVQERIALPAAPRARPLEGAAALTPADIYAMIRRRMVLISVLFVLFSILSVGVYFVVRKYFPLYSAKALVELVSNLPESELSVDQPRLREDEHERFVLTQAAYLKSPYILQETLKLQAVRETQWFQSTDQDERLTRLTEELSAGPMRGTNFMAVSMACRKKDDPHIIVNAAVSRWMAIAKDRSTEGFRAQLDASQRILNRLDTQIESERVRLDEIAGNLPAGAAYMDVNITAQQVMGYGEQVTLLSLELAQLEQFRQVYNDPTGVAVTAEDRQIIEQDPNIQALAMQEFNIRQQTVADAQTFGEEHPVTKALRSQLEAATKSLEQMRTRKLIERRGDMREAANTAYFNTQHALFVTQENLKKAEASLQDQDRDLFRYENLRSEIEELKEYRIKLRDYVNSLRRIKDQKTAMRVNVAQQAIRPIERSRPKLLMLPLGIMLSLALAVGIGLAAELLDTSVRTSQDIVRHLDIAMLGAVPHVDDEEISIDHVETAVRDAPRSMVAEAFRRIRTNLQFSAPAARQRALMITSPQPEDGKTTVAINLATVVAQSGRRVLLVDANFRRPGIARSFEEAQGRGLSNLLVGEGSLSSYAVSSGMPFLDVLGSGPVPPNPAELLGSEHFGAFLEDAVSRYDQVFIDTAPVLLASDALVVSTGVDGTMLVVRAKENSRGVARRACGLLLGVNAHLFGAVLNAAQVTRGGYFREQFRSYYDYQLEGEAPVGVSPPVPRANGAKEDKDREDES